MKKIFIIFLILTTLKNLSYASFPIANTLKLTKDTLQTEEIKQYHFNLIKMGFDLDDCKCESCRESNEFSENGAIHRGVPRSLYVLSGLILLAVIVWFFVGITRLYNCVDSGNGSDCPQSAGQTKKGAPIELLWMSLLILISTGFALKARLIQRKNKRLSN